MKDYKMKLSPYQYQSKELLLDLTEKNSSELLNDYNSDTSNILAYNDLSYSINVFDENNNPIIFDEIYVNYEPIENSKNSWKNFKQIFIECFGNVKIEVIIDNVSYVTKNIHVMMKKDCVNKSIINMIDYIYENCDDYLYEEHTNSKTYSGLLKNDSVSIDTKLSLLNEIKESYVQFYRILQYSSNSKLVQNEQIGEFAKLKCINSNTIKYISYHPEELKNVNYNSGILINNKYYQPEKTLICSVTYSYNTYENQVIVGFLKTIINELNQMLACVMTAIKKTGTPKQENEYIDSSYYIYSKNSKMLSEYKKNIDSIQKEFSVLYHEYKKILNVSDYVVFTQPRYTAVFRTIMPYNIIFKKIVNWFTYGNFNLAKLDFLLSFISISKIYEYFCLIYICKTFDDKGYTIEKCYPYKYDELYYYKNTIYNNTFELSKGKSFITMYFQPIVYGKHKLNTRPNDIQLFRNTSLSITDPKISAMLDEKPSKTGNYYVPDYIIKVNKDNFTKYYIIDAKHSTQKNICKYQMPYLIFKYLFSISPIVENAKLCELCILCGKDEKECMQEIHDISNEMSIIPDNETYMITLSGININENKCLSEYISHILNAI